MNLETYTINKFSNDNDLGLEFSKYDFANFFKVVSRGEKSYFNICNTINFENVADVPASLCKVYEVKAGDTWTNISHRVYGTIRLWWLICKFNNISNPLEMPVAGTILKIPGDKIKNDIVNLLSTSNT